MDPFHVVMLTEKAFDEVERNELRFANDGAKAAKPQTQRAP